MDIAGRLYLGPGYRNKVGKLMKRTGKAQDTEAMRSILDQLDIQCDIDRIEQFSPQQVRILSLDEIRHLEKLRGSNGHTTTAKSSSNGAG